MGRKRNQGKARKAAKDKAQVEQLIESTAKRMQRMPCRHGAEHLSLEEIRNCFQFVLLFAERFYACGPQLPERLSGAKNATFDKYPDVWNDSTKLEMVMSYMLCDGTQAILIGNHEYAGAFATYARYFEQYIAVTLKQSQALPNWPKLDDTYNADEHTLVNFFRRRIPCCCLGEKYEDVKSITKMGHCYNVQCSIPDKKVERSTAKYCSRCRNVSYCSRECQVADWSRHKPTCDAFAAMKAKFEDKQQNFDEVHT
jgi:hypothetical protein